MDFQRFDYLQQQVKQDRMSIPRWAKTENMEMISSRKELLGKKSIVTIIADSLKGREKIKEVPADYIDEDFKYSFI